MRNTILAVASSIYLILADVAVASPIFDKNCAQGATVANLGGFIVQKCRNSDEFMKIDVNGNTWSGIFSIPDQCFFLVQEPGLKPYSTTGEVRFLYSTAFGKTIDPSHNGIRSGINTILVDCQQKKKRVIKTQLYNGYFGEGSLVVNAPVNEDWSYDSSFASIVCIR